MRLYELNTNIKNTVSPEYVAMKGILQWMQKNNIQQISWRDFQKQFQQIGQRYAGLLTQIRRNRPQISQADFKTWLQNYQHQEKYDVAYTTYDDPAHSFRDVEQTVMQINRRAEITDDHLLAQYLNLVAQGSQFSGHPAGTKTVGWLRIDEINKNWLLIDEIQSDLINSVTQAKSIIQSSTYDDFVGKFSEEGQRLAREKVSPEQFYQTRRMLPMYGYNIKKLEEIRVRLIELFRDWVEEAMSTLIEVARENGIAHVALHTSETIAQRDPLVGKQTDKMKMFYDNVAKSFGFKKQQVSTPEFKGIFWVKDVL